MPGWIGLPELGLLLLVVLLVFGPKRLPEMGRSLGKGMREFKDSITGKDKDDDDKDAELPALTPSIQTNATVTPDESIEVAQARAARETAAAQLKQAEDQLRAAESTSGKS